MSIPLLLKIYLDQRIQTNKNIFLMKSMGRRNQFQMEWTIKFLWRKSLSIFHVLTSLHIEILGRRSPPPPGNAMMHFTDKIGKLFSSSSVFLHYHILGASNKIFGYESMFRIPSNFKIYLWCLFSRNILGIFPQNLPSPSNSFPLCCLQILTSFLS